MKLNVYIHVPHAYDSLLHVKCFSAFISVHLKTDTSYLTTRVINKCLQQHTSDHKWLEVVVMQDRTWYVSKPYVFLSKT